MTELVPAELVAEMKMLARSGYASQIRERVLTEPELRVQMHIGEATLARWHTASDTSITRQVTEWCRTQETAARAPLLEAREQRRARHLEAMHSTTVASHRGLELDLVALSNAVAGSGAYYCVFHFCGGDRLVIPARAIKEACAAVRKRAGLECYLTREALHIRWTTGRLRLVCTRPITDYELREASMNLAIGERHGL